MIPTLSRYQTNRQSTYGSATSLDMEYDEFNGFAATGFNPNSEGQGVIAGSQAAIGQQLLNHIQQEYGLAFNNTRYKSFRGGDKSAYLQVSDRPEAHRRGEFSPATTGVEIARRFIDEGILEPTENTPLDYGDRMAKDFEAHSLITGEVVATNLRSAARHRGKT